MKSLARAVLLLLIVSLIFGYTSFKFGYRPLKQFMFNSMISADRSRSGLVPGAVQINGQKTAFLERAGTGETIVLVHGYTGNKDNWNSFVRYIPMEYRVIAFDMPGHGDNDKPVEQTYTADYMASRLDQAVNALGIPRFHLAGNSMGGWISILYAHRYPRKVISLCLLDSAGLMNASPRKSDLQIEMSKGHNPFLISSREDYDEFLEYVFYKRPFFPWPIISVASDMLIASRDFYRKVGDDLLTKSTDIYPLLAEIEAPVLVIWGDKDRILHVSTTEVLKKSLPDSEIVIMKDCGHVPMMERPRETAEYYINFLSRHKLGQRLSGQSRGSPLSSGITIHDVSSVSGSDYFLPCSRMRLKSKG